MRLSCFLTSAKLIRGGRYDVQRSQGPLLKSRASNPGLSTSQRTKRASLLVPSPKRMLRAIPSAWAIYALTLLSQAHNTSIPLAAPPSSQPLSRNLLSFSIEQDRWPDWTGVDSRNEFTHNALQNLAQLTGKPPKIRVGANSEDHTVWSPSVTVSAHTSSLSAP